MKNRLPFAAALAAVCLTLSLLVPAQAEDWPSLVVAKAVNDGGKVTISFEGKEGYYFNTAFPAKVTLTPPEGVTVEKKKLGMKDAKLTDHNETTKKAKKAEFATTASADEPIAIKYRIVICSAKSCSPPFGGALTAK